MWHILYIHVVLDHTELLQLIAGEFSREIFGHLQSYQRPGLHHIATGARWSCRDMYMCSSQGQQPEPAIWGIWHTQREFTLQGVATIFAAHVYSAKSTFSFCANECRQPCVHIQCTLTVSRH